MIKDNIAKKIFVICLIFSFILISFIPSIKGNTELIDKILPKESINYDSHIIEKPRVPYVGQTTVFTVFMLHLP
jgi:hypothetical protein